MREVSFLFRSVEVLMGMLCFAFHIEGVLIVEKMNHIMIFCGTYFGFSYCALILNIGMFFNNNIPLFLEIIITLLAAISFLLSSVLSMYFAEQDTHLMFLSPDEETTHPFFAVAKWQSSVSLFTGLFYLLHFLLASDKYFVRGAGTINEFAKYEEADIQLIKTEQKIDLKIMPDSWRDELIKIKYVDRLFEIPKCDCKEIEKISRMELK
ncbi:hypothetical protein ACFFRR_009979 [Megaselia abdita]